MTLDLAELRRAAEKVRDRPPIYREVEVGEKRMKVKEFDSVAYDIGFDAQRAFHCVATPNVVLELLDRLERAEKKLAERDTVYPTLMTQVGKEKP